MSILWSRRQIGKTCPVGPHGERTYRVPYLLRSDRVRELRETMLQSSVGPDPLPAYGSLHVEDTTATCTRIDPQEVKEDPYLWHVVCEWQTKHGGQDPGNEQLLPHERWPIWTSRYTKLNRSRTHDLAGRCFKDSARTPFNPPIALSIIVREWTVRCFYQANFDLSWLDQFIDACNGYSWLWLDPDEAMIEDIAHEPVFEMGDWYYAMVFRILTSPRVQLDWGRIEGDLGEHIWEGGFGTEYILDAGPNKLIDASPPPNATKPVAILDSDENGKQYVSGSPRLLDGSGGLLAEGDEEIYLEFVTKYRADFNLLAIGSPY